MCPFEQACLGKARAGTTEVSWEPRSLIDIPVKSGRSITGWKAPSSSSPSFPGAGGSPLSAPFSCFFLQICFLCLLMAFLLPPNLVWLWSWLWPGDSSLRMLSFPVAPPPSSLCLAARGLHSQPARQKLPGAFRLPYPSRSNQLWSEVA